ncbi:hypothetical protein NW062_04425 [Mycoplasmopsis cynos]|nr:hypothetical protein NW062_04425 [Mycoplasmopsis cynos]
MLSQPPKFFTIDLAFSENPRCPIDFGVSVVSVSKITPFPLPGVSRFNFSITNFPTNK